MSEERESVLAASGLDRLIAALARRDYELIGPVIRHGAIVYDHIDSIADLPNRRICCSFCVGVYR